MQLLSHYTKPESFTKILQNRSFWASEFCSLNDPKEITFTLNAIVKRAAEIYFLNVPVELKTNIDQISLADQMARALTDYYLKVFSEGDGYGSWYFVSFAQGKDDSENNFGIPKLWKDYSTHLGFCLQFERKEILNLLRREQERYIFEYIGLIDVSYQSPTLDSNFESIAEQFALRVLKDISVRLGRGDLQPSDHLLLPDFTFYQKLFWICAKHKDPFWSIERETRIVISPHRNDTAQMKSLGFRRPTISIRELEDQTIRYVSIFGNNTSLLTPKRVLIGAEVSKEVEEKYKLIYRNRIEFTRPTSLDETWPPF